MRKGNDINILFHNIYNAKFALFPVAVCWQWRRAGVQRSAFRVVGWWPVEGNISGHPDMDSCFPMLGIWSLYHGVAGRIWRRQVLRCSIGKLSNRHGHLVAAGLWLHWVVAIPWREDWVRKYPANVVLGYTTFGNGGGYSGHSPPWRHCPWDSHLSRISQVETYSG